MSNCSAVNVRDTSEIERAIAAFVRRANGGLMITGGSSVTPHRDLIIELAAQLRLPAIYPFRDYVAGGGLMSYGPDQSDQFRRAAGYVDRILKGEKPADLPVQAADKVRTGRRTSKWRRRLGLTFRSPLLARAEGDRINLT